MASLGKGMKAFTGSAAVAVAAVVLGVVWFSHGPGVTASERGPAAEMSADEFNRRVRDFILENPEVLVEAMQRFEARQMQAAQNAARAVIKERGDEIFRDPETPVGGNPNGDVTLVEFFDYNCPYCRRVAPTMAQVTKADSGLRVAYKEFPILGPGSLFAAKAALAARRQGDDKYLVFHEALMKHKGRIEEKATFAVAEQVGLDVARLRTDMEDPKIGAALDRNNDLAQALRIDGTPGFVVGERIIPGAVDLKVLQEAIREARSSTRAENAEG